MISDTTRKILDVFLIICILFMAWTIFKIYSVKKDRIINLGSYNRTHIERDLVDLALKGWQGDAIPAMYHYNCKQCGTWIVTTTEKLTKGIKFGPWNTKAIWDLGDPHVCKQCGAKVFPSMLFLKNWVMPAGDQKGKKWD